MTIKAVSIKQPWASLIMCGAKRYETRSWRALHRGLLVIHASLRMTTVGLELCQRPFVRKILEQCNVDPDDMPRGMLLGTVDLVDTVPSHDLKLARFEREVGDFRSGRWAWEMRPRYRTPNPPRVRGTLSLWKVDEKHVFDWDDPGLEDA